MNHSSKLSLLEKVIDLLVQHFGIEKVQAALAKVSTRGGKEPQKLPRKIGNGDQKPPFLTVTNTLELIRQNDPEKHRLLNDFFNNLKDRKVLPESQDVRYFAQLVGLKDIKGKSRKNLIPPLVRFLMEQSNERLRINLQSADDISEQQRQQGFSVLTDKLLSE